MEKFSGKEKIALGVFGLILLAIIVQVLVSLRTSPPPPIRGEVVEEAGLDLTGNLLTGPGARLEASSRNEVSQMVEMLRDGRDSTFWHVALDRVGLPAWVTVDFGEGNERAVRTLMARPRRDITRQFFRSAELLGSDDGQDWEPVAGLLQWGPPVDSSWIRWDFENDRAFRHYKLAIADGHEGNRFYSMAELALFE